jgi:hypothetical protein
VKFHGSVIAVEVHILRGVGGENPFISRFEIYRKQLKA